MMLLKAGRTIAFGQSSLTCWRPRTERQSSRGGEPVPLVPLPKTGQGGKPCDARRTPCPATACRRAARHHQDIHACLRGSARLGLTHGRPRLGADAAQTETPGPRVRRGMGPGFYALVAGEACAAAQPSKTGPRSRLFRNRVKPRTTTARGSATARRWGAGTRLLSLEPGRARRRPLPNTARSRTLPS